MFTGDKVVKKSTCIKKSVDKIQEKKYQLKEHINTIKKTNDELLKRSLTTDNVKGRNIWSKEDINSLRNFENLNRYKKGNGKIDWEKFTKEMFPERSAKEVQLRYGLTNKEDQRKTNYQISTINFDMTKLNIEDYYFRDSLLSLNIDHNTEIYKNFINKTTKEEKILFNKYRINEYKDFFTFCDLLETNVNLEVKPMFLKEPVFCQVFTNVFSPLIYQQKFVEITSNVFKVSTSMICACLNFPVFPILEKNKYLKVLQDFFTRRYRDFVVKACNNASYLGGQNVQIYSNNNSVLSGTNVKLIEEKWFHGIFTLYGLQYFNEEINDYLKFYLNYLNTLTVLVGSKTKKTRETFIKFHSRYNNQELIDFFISNNLIKEYRKYIKLDMKIYPSEINHKDLPELKFKAETEYISKRFIFYLFYLTIVYSLRINSIMNKMKSMDSNYIKNYMNGNCNGFEDNFDCFATNGFFYDKFLSNCENIRINDIKHSIEFINNFSTLQFKAPIKSYKEKTKFLIDYLIKKLYLNNSIEVFSNSIERINEDEIALDDVENIQSVSPCSSSDSQNLYKPVESISSISKNSSVLLINYNENNINSLNNEDMVQENRMQKDNNTVMDINLEELEDFNLEDPKNINYDELTKKINDGINFY